MTGILAIALASLAGCLLVHCWCPIGPFNPGWLRWAATLAVGAAAGLGLSSGLFFLMLWAGVATPATVVAMNVALVAVAGGAWRFRRRPPAEPTPALALPAAEIWALRAGCGLLLVLLLYGWGVATEASPHGDWDAFSIWNLRAKFLASGSAGWRHAVSPKLSSGLLGASHPDYPLLLPAVVAQAWMLSGDTSPAIPQSLGLAFVLLLLALVAGLTAWLRGEAAAWVAVLVLAGSELFASQIAAQYADIPLACYAVATVALLAGSMLRQWAAAGLFWAGLLAGLAAWTKNEGLVFVLLALLWCAWRGGRRAAMIFLAGATPGLALVACLKLLLAPATTGLFPATLAEALHKLSELERWRTIAGAYLRTVLELGAWWAHPLLLLALWLWAAGRARPGDRRAAWVSLIPLAMLAADFAVYLLSVADLRWHLGTSLNRLWLQMWPSLLVALLLATGPASIPEPSKPSTRARRRREACQQIR